MRFKTWLEQNDIFGFDKPAKIEPRSIIEEEPIKSFNSEYAIDLLLEKNLNSKHAFSRFSNEIQWGSGSGAIKLKISPMFDAFIYNLIHDLEGNPTWICRKVFQINNKDFAGRERVVSEDLFEQIQKIDQSGLLYAKEEMDFASFVSALVNRLKHFKSEIFYYKGTKKLHENNYLTWFEIKGQGSGRVAGSHAAASILQMITDMSFNPKTGLIRLMLTNVNDNVDEPTSWELWYSDFNEQYSPIQSRDEIIETFLCFLKYY